MNRIEFHDVAALGSDLRSAVVALLRARHASGESVLVLAESATQADEIDAWLWDAGDEVFLPHAIGSADPAQAPIAIASPGDAAVPRACTLNLRGDAVLSGAAGEAPLILELIPLDEVGRQAARQRWRAYTAAGLTPVKAS